MRPFPRLAFLSCTFMFVAAMCARPADGGEPKWQISGEGAEQKAVLETDRLKLTFQARGGKCVSFAVKAPDGPVELTDKTGVFEDHLSTQSYLKSDFRRANFAMKMDRDALVLTAEATSPDVQGVKMEKFVCVRGEQVFCQVRVTNGGTAVRNVGLWQHQAFHTKDGTTRYFFPTERGIQAFPYDPKGEASEVWMRDPARRWCTMVSGPKGKGVGVVCEMDWFPLDHFFCYRSDLYATMEWRTIEKKLAPGASFETFYSVFPVIGLDAVHGFHAPCAFEVTPQGTPPAEARVRCSGKAASPYFVSVRKAGERVAAGAGEFPEGAGEMTAKLPEDLRTEDAAIRLQVKHKDGQGGHAFDMPVAGKPFLMEPMPMREAAKKKIPSGRQDILYELSVATPHTPWGRPYYRGTVKAWILSPITPNGDTVELLKRFDIDYDIVSCDWSWEMNTWGMGDAYGKRSNKESQGRDLEWGYATEDLTSEKPYDVIVLPTIIGINAYPEKMRAAILRRVEEGAGLVLINPQECKEKPKDEVLLPKVNPFAGASPTQYHWYGDWQRHVGRQDPKPWTIQPGQEKHPIVSGVCWEAMPLATAVAIQDHKLADGATAIVKAGDFAAIATRTCGKGRVVAVNWHSGQGASITPVENEGKCPTWDYWEGFYNIVGRAALWAAGREPEVSAEVKAGADGKVSVAAENGLRALDASAHVILKDELGRVVSAKDYPQKLAKGLSSFDVAVEKLPGGTNTIEVILQAGPYRLGWGAAQVAVPKAAQVSSVTIGPDPVKDGEAVKGEATVSGKLAGGTLDLELRDPFGRVLARKTQDVNADGETKVAYEFPVKDSLALAEFVRARLSVGGAVASEKDSPVVVVTPAEPAFTDYEVIPWGFASRRCLWDAKARVYRQFNATGGSGEAKSLWYGFIAKGHAEPRAARNVLGVYYFDNERDNLTKKWNDYQASGDKKVLTRQACLSDQALLDKVASGTKEQVRKQKKFNPGTYYIGDESSFTCYGMEMDLDFNPIAIGKFREWLKGRYGEVGKLNEKWQTDFKSFDEVVPFTIVEVEKDVKKAVGWAEHRTFVEETYENVFRLIRESAKAEDPNAEMELSGTQPPSSFTATDWARLGRHVRRYIPYSGDFMWDMFRCFSPGVRMCALTGYGSHGPGVKMSLWSQAFHGLSAGSNIFWEWSLVDADMTLSKNAVDIGEVFRDLRGRGIGRLIGSTKWVKSPVAIYYSMPSIHAARIQKRERFPTACRNAWAQMTRDLGLQFDFVSYLQVEDGGLQSDPPQVLVLAGALAVSPKEAEAIRKFAEAGGIVVADQDPGICDDRCDFRSSNLLAGLFSDGKASGTKAVGKGKAILLAKDFGEYPKKRGDKAGVEMRAEVGKLFADLKVAPTIPVTLADGSPLTKAEVVVMERGAAKYLAIVKENLTGIRRTTPDGVEYFEPLPEGQSPPIEKIAGTLPAELYAYDIRKGKAMGKTRRIEDTLESAEAKLYALLPYEVKGVKVEMDGALKAGAAVPFSVTVDGAQGDHVINVKVFDKGGAELFYYTKNLLAAGGKAQGAIPLALNVEGPMKAVFTDVATGAKAEVEIK